MFAVHYTRSSFSKFVGNHDAHIVGYVRSGLWFLLAFLFLWRRYERLELDSGVLGSAEVKK